jgi:hypothetical protein
MRQLHCLPVSVFTEMHQLLVVCTVELVPASGSAVLPGGEPAGPWSPV